MSTESVSDSDKSVHHAADCIEQTEGHLDVPVPGNHHRPERN
jgi:hypothetical protein